MMTKLFNILNLFGDHSKSVSIDEPLHLANLPKIEVLTIECHVKRESVCAADDVYAPNAEDFSCSVNLQSENFALDCVEQIACNHVYLPSVAGQTTWIAYVDDVPVAVLREPATAIGESEKPVLYATGKQPEFCKSNPYFSVYLDYYMSNDENRILSELANGQVPEKRYSE